MNAAILECPGRFTLEDRPVPDVGPGEVRVRAAVCGVCTSEVDMFEGRNPTLEYPRFIGHEVSGVVDAVGPRVSNVKEGDRVAVYAEGEGYAEYVTVPASWAVPLADGVPFEHALGEPIACSVNGVRKADPEIGDSVCLVGCGFMGLIMLQAFRARGVGDIVVVDPRTSARELALRLGADHAVEPDDAQAFVMDVTDGAGVDVGVEAAGIQATLDLTSQLVRQEGVLEVFGFHQGAPRQVDWGWWNWRAFRIVNGHTRNPDVYVEGIRLGLGMIERGDLDMGPLVTHRYALGQINDGFQAASAKEEGFIKGVIAFDP
ncbi:alcohol dehydrogenase catalytic domain-containing protein [Rubrivirga sp.]|uniref:alcohol dehydrogenase catalytic domain-containing protein n=1 Tax=Rubrivirga sp. TaxID=1885344 RepID=UPI003B5290CE